MGISCRTNKTRRNLKVFVSGWADYIDPTIEDLELPDGEVLPDSLGGAIEPQTGIYDRSYLGRVEQMVDQGIDPLYP